MIRIVTRELSVSSHKEQCVSHFKNRVFPTLETVCLPL